LRPAQPPNHHRQPRHHHAHHPDDPCRPCRRLFAHHPSRRPCHHLHRSLCPRPNAHSLRAHGSPDHHAHLKKTRVRASRPDPPAQYQGHLNPADPVLPRVERPRRGNVPGERRT
ncbi:hypothetical protein BCR44DRAFT_1435117, partial [Catenaria anguillulae PL171]